jgi:hypothetical protein
MGWVGVGWGWCGVGVCVSGGCVEGMEARLGRCVLTGGPCVRGCCALCTVGVGGVGGLQVKEKGLELIRRMGQGDSSVTGSPSVYVSSRSWSSFASVASSVPPPPPTYTLCPLFLALCPPAPLPPCPPAPLPPCTSAPCPLPFPPTHHPPLSHLTHRHAGPGLMETRPWQVGPQT